MVLMKYGVSYGPILQRELSIPNPALEELMLLVGSYLCINPGLSIYSVIFRKCNKSML